MPILEKTDTAALEEIRSLVSIASDAKDLPDTVIQQEVFLGDANLRIQAAILDWETREGDAALRLRILTMKACAVNLLVAFARVQREQVEALSVDRHILTPAEAIEAYERDIAEGITFLTETEGSAPPGGGYLTAAVVV